MGEAKRPGAPHTLCPTTPTSNPLRLGTARGERHHGNLIILQEVPGLVRGGSDGRVIGRPLQVYGALTLSSLGLSSPHLMKRQPLSPVPCRKSPGARMEWVRKSLAYANLILL
ncbi:hypothetical protein BaRGS_00033937 [Batillaria attramentaria]|uniref:Uncharacterized protein n=1 Tax=Batillaria attramentaria TaxID=370345 RepID=A0ABD0JJP5_9CAEN